MSADGRIPAPEETFGSLADRVHAAIVMVKAGVREMEDVHLALTIAAGRPPGAGPAVEAMASDSGDYVTGLIKVILAECRVDPEDPEVQAVIRRRLAHQERVLRVMKR